MCYRKIDSTKYSCGHDIPHGDQRIDCNSARCRCSSAHQDDYKSTSSKQWLDINSATNPLDTFTINDGLCPAPEHSGLDISWTRCSNNTCTSASGLHSLVWCPQCSSGTSYIELPNHLKASQLIEFRRPLNPTDSIRENGWGCLDDISDFLSSPRSTTNLQPVEPSSGSFILGMLQRGEKQQSFDSGRQSSYRSHDANHSNIELHPSQSSGAEVRPTSQPVPTITIRPTAPTNLCLPLSGPGTTSDNTTEPRCTVESSNGTSRTLKVIDLEDIEVTCLLCGGTFLGCQTNSHLRENHPTLVPKNDRTLCPLCTTPAKEVTNFCRHFQKHHKILRFKCSRCSYTALERWNVERHVQKMRGKSRCESCRQSNDRGLRDGLMEP